ncbi:MAG: 5-formyltetrahydrofolate cyclo-ligase [Clostridia bacterium]|nr:5-formyltetrahydrofolate cyclo-ligase [Clostridia bacterium]
MTADSPEEKSRLRAEYSAKRQSIGRTEKQDLDLMICRGILSLDCFVNAESVFLYSPVNQEIDIGFVISFSLSSGKIVAFPQSLSGGEMVFRSVESTDELHPGRFGIPEPDAHAPAVSSCRNSVCLVPSLVFDRRGYRIGYGGGYYDRFLSSFEGTAVGLIYENCLIESVPREAHDVAVDIIVSEKGTYTTDGKQKNLYHRSCTCDSNNGSFSGAEAH